VDLATEYTQLVEDLEREGVRLLQKDRVWHQRAIHRLLAIVTLGAQSHYLDAYVTTIGSSIFLPPDFASRPLADRYATLRHEAVHLEQFRRWGFLPMAIAYLLLPFPVGLAWCRMRLERAAYEESIRVHHHLGGRAATDRLRTHVIRQFTSGSYGWMWPFPRAVARWYDGFVARLDMN
jgi:hypothetical protein